MDEGKKYCGVISHIWHRKSDILGGLLILFASIATLLSFSGLGLFGMFLAGIALICRHHWKSGCCATECCMKSCHTDMGSTCADEKPVKKTKTKKND